MTMLQDYLSQFDPEEANEILAEAALATSPIPETEGHPIEFKRPTELKELLSAARKQLGLSESDASGAASAKLDTLLASTLTKRILKNVNTNEVLSRAGQAGRLDPYEYQVLPSPDMKLFVTLGVRPSHVEDAVRSPDHYQSVMEDGTVDKQVVSLFLKHIFPNQVADSFILVVQTHRAGAQQIPRSAWRVYPADVTVEDSADPLKVIESFVQSFGIEFRVNGVRSKFIAQKDFPAHEDVTIDYGSYPDLFSTASSGIKQNGEGMVVGMIYAIDMLKYAASLKSHGVNVSYSPAAHRKLLPGQPGQPRGWKVVFRGARKDMSLLSSSE